MKSKIILAVLLFAVIPVIVMAKNMDIAKRDGGISMELVITKENFQRARGRIR